MNLFLDNFQQCNKNFNYCCKEFLCLSFRTFALQLFLYRVMRASFDESFHQCVTFNAYSAPWQEKFYTIGSLVLHFLLPLVIIIGVYAVIIYTIARKTNRSITGEGKSNVYGVP